MSFFRRLFSSAPTVEDVNSAIDKKRWSDVLSLAEAIDRSLLDERQCKDLDDSVLMASDNLAAMNLAEGEAWARQGDFSRAQEHFLLAHKQAKSQKICFEIGAALDRTSANSTDVDLHSSPLASSCSSSCCSPAEEAPTTPMMEMDLESQLDLVLSGYPEAYAKRYLTLPPALIDAVLLSHESRADEALEKFSQVENTFKCETFFFERGSLYARQLKPALAIEDLQESLRLDPQHQMALELMIDLLLESGHPAEAQKCIESSAGLALSKIFRYSRLARSCYLQEEMSQALGHAQRAIDSGSRENVTLELAAMLYEQDQDLDRAEQILMLIGGGGCSGGQNLLLAEFRFRHGRDLPRALETYKSLARLEPANASWLLRVGQIYLRQGWIKEGKAILETLSSSTLVSAEIRQVAEQELDQ